MALTPEQKKILARITAIGRQRGEGPMKVKANVETGLVESNLRNLPGGDADSQGYRQERTSLYKDPTNLDAAINRFYDEADKAQASGNFKRAGDLAAAVQRPAAQYRGRYQQRSSDADSLLGKMGGAGAVGKPAAASTTTRTSTVPDETARRQAVAQFLLTRHQDPNALLTAVSSLQGATKTQTTVTPSSAAKGVSATGAPSSQGKGGAGSAVEFARSRIGAYAETAGNNRGPQLDKLEKRFGMTGAAWCAMFTSVAVTRGGAPKVARTASVAAVRQQVQQGGGGYQHGFQGKPKAGDLMLFGNAHIGLVESVNGDGSVNLIDGNNSTGKVARRRVAASAGDIARPKYQQ